MTCERCKLSAVFIAHDARALDHEWPPGHEERCPCGVELVCAVCEADRINRDGFVLVERPTAMHGVATAGGLVH